MDNMLPRFNNELFTEIFPDFASFKYVFDNEFDQYAKNCITESSLKSLYWLLYSRYGYNPIVNQSIDLFKAKIVANTFQKGPTWEKKSSLQKSLRDLSEADMLAGAKTILNRALHDQRMPGTNTDEELPYINQQDVSKHKRSKLDALGYLQDLLKTDVTEEFINSFAKLFSKFVSPTITRIYENEEDY